MNRPFRFTIRFSHLLVSICIVSSCVSGEKKPAKNSASDTRLRTYGAKKLSMHDLLSEASSSREPEWQRQEDPAASTKKRIEIGKNRLAPTQTFGRSSASGESTSLWSQAPTPTLTESDCQVLKDRITSRYVALRDLLPKDTHFSTENPIIDLINSDKDACTRRQMRPYTLELLNKVRDNHSGRIGMILPVTGRRSEQIVQILAGMRAFFKDAGLDFDKIVILKDSGNTAHGAEVGFAELVLVNNVQLVIGGLEQAESEILAQWGASLNFPTLLMSPSSDLASLAPSIYILYPNEKKLAETLAQKALSKQKKRIAILKPNTGRADRLTKFFRDALTESGGVITTEIEYVSGNYESMQKAARDLFQINASDRAAELRGAYEKAKSKAAEEHVGFNPKEVLLPPIIDFDALFLPDDFRSVRHFAKLFKFHMVDKITLIGNHEWRSFGLVDPPEPMLDGSFFADFVGSYASLPQTLAIPQSSSPWFIDPDLVTRVDFRLIGYRIGRVIRGVIGQAHLKRSSIPAALSQLKIKDGQELTPVFDKKRVALWPTYVFRVTRDQLIAE